MSKKKTNKIKPPKDWVAKLNDDKDLPKVVKIEGKLSGKWGKGTCAIPAPRDVDAIMKKVPAGKVTTINEIRNKVSRDHHATIGCPITSGIFAWISANAAEQERQAGKKNITPYWRTLKTGGEINFKYPGGVAGQKKLLKKEGHKFAKKGKRTIVADWQEKLYRPS